MSLFDHGKYEECLLFVRNFNMTLAATGAQWMDARIHYLRTLFCGEALRQFNLLSADVENTETLNLYYYIKGLAVYFLPVNSLSKKTSRDAPRNEKLYILSVRCYAARLIDLNEYLASFPGEFI